MKLLDLPFDQAQPIEVIYKPKWLDPLLKGALVGVRPFDDAAKFESIPGVQAPQRRQDGDRRQDDDRRQDNTGGLRTLVAVTPQHRDAAERLVRKRYESRGYRFYSEAMDFDSPIAKDRHVTLLAEDGGKVLGTVTIRVADATQGLLAQKSYGSEIEGMCDQGHSIGEVVKLAVEDGADWKAVLNALLQATYLVARTFLALTDLFIEVNPRHVRFYQRVFGFVVASAESMCERVGAPSVLLRLNLDEFSRKLQFAQA
jgi:hypothetical protein